MRGESKMPEHSCETLNRVHCRRIHIAVCGCAIAVAASAFGAAPVTVYIEPPSQLDAHALARANMECLARELPENKQRWESKAVANLSYTLTPESGDLLQGRCENLPIRIRIQHGRLASATYDATRGGCKKGSPVRHNESYLGSRFLTPATFFHEIDLTVAHKDDSERNCMQRVTFDSAIGLPLNMGEGCPWIADGGWSLQISAIAVGTNQ